MIYHKITPLTDEDQATIERLSTELGLPPLVTGILVRRHLTEKQQIEEFLEGKPQPYYDPFLLKDMDKAVARICQALQQGEPMTIYGDYDVDGTSASSLLYLFLKAQGASVDVYVPRRDTEGYGLNGPALEKLARKGTRLLITVDTGISGAPVVDQAPKDLDIIITDHHLAPRQLPAALAVVNPNQPGDTYPFKGIAGVGVAFKLCQALYQKLHHTDAFWDDLIELVALGTVADMVPLRDENREIVRKGLAKMPHTSLCGLQALIGVTVAPGAAINSGTIGFGLGPRINAAGRLDDAMVAVQLLTTEDPARARELASQLNSANQERQALSQKIFEEAEQELARQGAPEWGVVLGREGWHPGVIGIVASRITEKYHLPSILLSVNGDMAKGSCRSIPPLDLYKALDRCREYLEQFGGHAQAAGLTIKTANIDAFRRAFQDVVADMLDHVPYEPAAHPDYFVPEGREVTVEAVQQLARLEPFGVGNPAPVLGFSHATIDQVALLGKDQNHLRFDLHQGGFRYKGLLWQEGPQFHSFYAGEQGAIAFSPRLNTFRGVTSVDLEVAAVEAPYTIIDWRHENRNKETELNSILQKDRKTVVYVQDTVPLKDRFPEAILLPYGTEAPKGTRTTVFYGAGADRVLSAGAFPLDPRQTGRLYLFYNRDDLVALRDALRRSYPDLGGMRFCYAAIRHLLQQQGACREAQLLGRTTREGYTISRQVLDIFYELHLFTRDRELVTLGDTGHKNMQESKGFQELQATYDRKFQQLNRSWLITPAEIAALWRTGR